MLIEKNTIEAGSIVTIKISSGEEIICKLVEITPETYVIHKPLTVNIVMSPNGSPAVSMMPFIVTSDEDAKIIIGKEKIIIISKSNAEATKGYIKNTSSLVVPSGKLIV